MLKPIAITQWLFWCFLPALLTCNIYGQDNGNIPGELVDRLERASEQYPAEEVYIQTSKDIYETGEDLWFKGYRIVIPIFDALSNEKNNVCITFADAREKTGVGRKIYN